MEVGTGFHPELTGRENIYLNGAILGMSKAEIRIKFDEIVAFAEIEKFLDTPVKRYSSGMYVRLAFSVAAHLEPEILLVDEVLAVGDIAFQKKCLGKMSNVVKSGRTVLFVSHNMGAINQLCCSTIWLDSGYLRGHDRTETIVESYLESLQEEGASKQFPIKPDAKAQINSVRILDKNEIERSEYQLGTEPTVEISYTINEHVRGLHVACILNSIEGHHIFSTADSDLNPSLLELERKSGEYMTRLQLPVSLLNKGNYKLTVGIGIPGVEIFDRQTAPSFTLHDLGGFATFKEKNGRSGLILVEVVWKYFKWAGKCLS